MTIGTPHRLVPSRWRMLTCSLLLLGSLSLTACGAWDDWWNDDVAETTELSGVAATGAAIANGNITVVNASGETVVTRTNSSGQYSVTIGDAPPFVLSVVDGSGKTWYSYAATGGTAHITPLTTLALLDANGNRPLADLVAAWTSAPLTAAQVSKGAQVLNANLRGLMSSVGVDPGSTNVFNAPGFSANRTGLDAVLDAMRVSVNCTPTACSQSITTPAGSPLVAWNGNIATTGITVSWASTTAAGSSIGATSGSTSSAGSTSTASGSLTVGLGSCKAPRAGTWSLVVQTSVAGVGGLPIPEVCVDGLPAAPASQSEFCASDTTKAQLPPGVEIVSCSFSGDTGTITARVTTPIALEYSVKYVFVKR